MRLEVRGLSRRGVLHDVSLSVRGGEVVGLAGLVGAGRTELARCLFGADGINARRDPPRWLDRRYSVAGPRGGLGDRVGAGGPQAAGAHPGDGRCGRTSVFPFWIDWVPRSCRPVRRERALVSDYIRSLRIRTPHMEQRVSALSGGNQQKVVIARWLATKPKVLILDEPTRGIDVGAKAEVHALIARLAEQGVAILMISSELPEILGMSHRILVMRGGRIVADIPRQEATEESIMAAATGQALHSAVATA